MAKAKTTAVKSYFKKPKVKRPGIHSKKKSSQHKRARNYKKLNRGQG